MPNASYCQAHAHDFSSVDRARGDSYFNSGRILGLNVAAQVATAVIIGSRKQPYRVVVKLGNTSSDESDYSCSCPQFQRAGCCKHIWAVLRKIDADASREKPVEENRTLAVSQNSSPKSLETAKSDKSIAAETARVSGGPAQMTSGPSLFELLDRQVQKIYAKQLQKQTRLLNGKTPRYLLDLTGQRGEWPSLQIVLDDSAEEDSRWYNSRQATHRELERHQNACSPADQSIISRLLFANPDFSEDNYRYGYGWRSNYQQQPSSTHSFEVNDKCPPMLLREVARTGRLYWRVDPAVQPEPFLIETYAETGLALQLVIDEMADKQIRMSLQFQLDEAAYSVSDVAWAWESGLVLLPGLLGEIDPLALPWLSHWMSSGDQSFAADQRDGLILSLLGVRRTPAIVWPAAWNLQEEVGTPQPVLVVKWPERMPQDLSTFLLNTNVAYRYFDGQPAVGEPPERIYDADNSRILHRDTQREQTQLQQLVVSETLAKDENGGVGVMYSALPTLAERLAPIGWTVEAEGRPLVAPGHFSLDVTSGIDWFDLSGGVAYADQIVPLPVLLQAVRNKEKFVRLDDGSHGMLPTKWVERFGKFLELANEEGDALRFGRAQAMILDSLLAEQEQADRINVDATFRRLRKQLAAFNGIKPGKEPRQFQGELREYQREGLGWFGFLQSFGFGGCLADDMGLGKTIQVLALLEQRRARRLKQDEVRKPSLVVVPKSLIFNWIDEAAKFTPRLNVIDFTGMERHERVDELATADVVLTTYGTLRQEIERLGAIEFDYAILDEAQAIKNPKTFAAKSCFALKADHRLAMTGTPIENHLGDLWSQFRFLNPGLLGHSSAFAAFNRADCEPEVLQQLSQALRPFILRRTKREVLKDLPEKTERTLYCEMSPKQTRQYNELREHYRLKLDDTVRQLGIQRAKIHVLEALLRLRQAACDGRLVNAKQGARGAKLDLLLEQITEVMEEGHKVLVFSQFTSLLALLQKDLKKRKLAFEYLDGKTSNRKARVARFQNDETCQLFLISLKAGGHGLNLTAADYVYILDPWWNPAAEAQAIDRAHRMGQENNVFAYRMITKGTVEEKILELQASKRELAESIVSGNSSLIRNLTSEDLQLLLG